MRKREGRPFMLRSGMLWTVLFYGLLLGAGAFALQFLEYRLTVLTHSVEVYVGLVALAFMGLGVWAGARLFRRPVSGASFERNTQVIATLGVSDREFEVLELLAGGGSNKEIAARLGVSPNTVKTHVARLYEKLEVSRRTQAIQRARELGMIP